MSATIQQCTSCSTTAFPFRLFCPACGRSDLVEFQIEHGGVEETTTLSDGTVLATVMCGTGTRLVARIVGGDVSSGSRVTLSNQLEGQQGVFAYVPFSRDTAY